MIPFISTVGWSLPFLVSGAEITAIVLNLPTSGPLLLEALRNQDMYLAGVFFTYVKFSNNVRHFNIRLTSCLGRSSCKV